MVPGTCRQPDLNRERELAGWSAMGQHMLI